VARVAGLIAIASLPLVAGLNPADALGPSELTHGFHRALLIAASLCVAGGVLAWTFIRSDVLRPSQPAPEEPAEFCFHCALDGTPLVAESG